MYLAFHWCSLRFCPNGSPHSVFMVPKTQIHVFLLWRGTSFMFCHAFPWRSRRWLIRWSLSHFGKVLFSFLNSYQEIRANSVSRVSWLSWGSCGAQRDGDAASAGLLLVAGWIKFLGCGQNNGTYYYLMNLSTSLSSFANQPHILWLLPWVIKIRGTIRMQCTLFRIYAVCFTYLIWLCSTLLYLCFRFSCIGPILKD